MGSPVDDALDRLEHFLANGDPRANPMVDIATVRSALEQLREERDDWEKIAEGRADYIEGWQLDAKVDELRAAEAELQRLRGGISVRDALVTENAIRAAAAEAEAQRYREGLREAVGMIRFPCAECKPFIDKARALLADSPPGTCCCPSGSYNPGAVHEPYCPAGGGAK